MSEQPSIRNDLSGEVRGHVVQSGAIHGDVVFTSPTAPMSRESLETQRRWEQRQRRILDQEDAQAAAVQRRVAQYLRLMQVRRRASGLILLISGLVAIVGHFRVLNMAYEGYGLLIWVVSVFGWVRCTLIIRRAEAGRSIKVPVSRRMW